MRRLYRKEISGSVPSSIVSLMIVTLAFLAGLTCAGPASAADKIPVLNIALIHTYSKADPLCYDPYGKSLLNGVEMAWDDFKRQNAPLGFDVRFVKYDLGDSKMKAMEMMDEADRDGAVAALGYICSDLALLGGKRAQELKIPMVTPTATDDRVADIGDYLFTAIFKNSEQGEALARYAALDLKKKKTLVISAVDCAFCTSLADSYERSFKRLGGSITGELKILTSERNFESVIKEAGSLDYDSVLLANYAIQIAGIIAEFLKSGKDVVFLGGDSWVWTERFHEIVGDRDFEGYSIAGWVPEFPTKKSKDFVANYRRRYKENLVDTAAHSYDAATILFNAIKNAVACDRQHIKTALYRIGTYHGVSGQHIFNGRNWPKHSFVLLKNTNKEQKIVRLIEPQ